MIIIRNSQRNPFVEEFAAGCTMAQFRFRLALRHGREAL